MAKNTVEDRAPGQANIPKGPQALKKRDGGFKLIRVGDIKLTPVDWAIDSYLEREAIVCLYGDPESYKSFLAIDMACCCAAGKRWHGNKSSEGPVIYIAGEGQRGMRRRVQAWCDENEVEMESLPLFISECSAQLFNKDHARDVEYAVRQRANEEGVHPVLVIVDTLV